MEKMSFDANYGYYNVNYPKLPQKAEQNEKVSFQVSEDTGMSTAAKLMIGATALAGVIALGVAASKGKLGEGAQKVIKDITKPVEVEKGLKLSDIKLPKNAEFKIVGKNGKYSVKTPSEFEKLLKVQNSDIEALESFAGAEDFKILTKYKNGKPKMLISKDGLQIGELNESGKFVVKYTHEATSEGKVLRKIEEFNCEKIEEIDEFATVTKSINLSEKGEIESVVKNAHEKCWYKEIKYKPDGKTPISSKYTESGDEVSVIFKNGEKYRVVEKDADMLYETEYWPGGKVVKTRKSTIPTDFENQYIEREYYKSGQIKSLVEKAADISTPDNIVLKSTIEYEERGLFGKLFGSPVKSVEKAFDNNGNVIKIEYYEGERVVKKLEDKGNGKLEITLDAKAEAKSKKEAQKAAEKAKKAEREKTREAAKERLKRMKDPKKATKAREKAALDRLDKLKEAAERHETSA